MIAFWLSARTKVVTNSTALAGLRRIGLNPAVMRAVALLDVNDERGAPALDDVEEPARSAAEGPWRVIEQQRSHWTLSNGMRTATAAVTAAWAERLSVGDWVIARELGEDRMALLSWVEPYSSLQRATARGTQVLVRNVDVALLVMGLDVDFNPRRIERYLALAAGGGASAVVVLTKRDIANDVDDKLDTLRARLPGATPIVAIDATDAEAARVLEPWLTEGTTAVLLGSSGAGKSTLTNTLAGESVQSVGAVREGDGRGRHTTTARTLRRLPGGACVIDTPGLRALALALDETSLDAAFGDIAALALECRFRDCTHHAEPGCAVREHIDPDRLKNYQKLAREAQRQQAKDSDDPNAFVRFESGQKAKWKAIHKSVRAFNKANRAR